MKKIYYYFILLLVFLLPLIFVSGIYSISNLPKILFLTIFLLSILFVDVFYLLKNQNSEIKINKDIIKYFSINILFLILIFITSIKSTDYFYGNIDRYIGFSIYFLSFIFSIHLIILKNNSLKNILKWLNIGLFIVGIISLFQYFGLFPDNLLLSKMIYEGRPTGTIGQYNSLSILMLFSVFISLYYLLKNKNKWYLIVVFIGILTIFLTKSRATILALFLGLILIFIYYLNRKNAKKSKIIYIGVIIFLFTLVSSIFVIDRFNFKGYNLSSVLSRIELIKYGKNIILNQDLTKTFFGNGVDSQKVLLVKEYSPTILKYEEMGQLPDSTHNVLLDSFIQFGLIGGLLFIILYYFYNFYLFYKIKNKEDLDYFLIILNFSIFINLLFAFNSITSLIHTSILSIYFLNRQDKYFTFSFKKYKYLILVIIFGFIIILSKLFLFYLNDFSSQRTYYSIKKIGVENLRTEILDSFLYTSREDIKNKLLITFIYNENPNIKNIKENFINSINDENNQLSMNLKYVYYLSILDENKFNYYIDKFLILFPLNIKALSVKGEYLLYKKDYKNAYYSYKKVFDNLPEFIFQENITPYEKRKKEKILKENPYLYHSLKNYNDLKETILKEK